MIKNKVGGFKMSEIRFAYFELTTNIKIPINYIYTEFIKIELGFATIYTNKYLIVIRFELGASQCRMFCTEKETIISFHETKSQQQKYTSIKHKLVIITTIYIIQNNDNTKQNINFSVH